jgi:F-type H+-transporting ATPase subunit a
MIKDLIHLDVGGYDLSFTQSSLVMLIGVVLTTVLMTLGVKNRQLVPGRLQNVPEMLYEFVAGIVNDNLHEEGKKYFPFVFSLFMLVLMGNLMGLVPGSFTYTSHIIVTGALALFVFFMTTIIGIARHGLHFFSIFLPPGLPLIMAFLIVPIEIISYLSRPLSLSVRLFANMTAGHTMLAVFGGFSVSLIGITMGAVLGILPVLVNVALLGLETMIAFIQAYVFAILTCIYIKSVIELH